MEPSPTGVLFIDRRIPLTLSHFLQKFIYLIDLLNLQGYIQANAQKGIHK